MELPTEDELAEIVGHEFPGGIYTVAHWENFLLTECTCAELLPDGMVHPAVLFHMPILGAQTSIAEMFALGKAISDFSIGIESYDWEMFSPIREEVAYKVTGKITEASRLHDTKPLQDRIQFVFEIHDKETLVSRCTVTWRYRRGPR